MASLKTKTKLYIEANSATWDDTKVSLQNDGSIRVYGSWTGVHTETGNEFNLGSYHTMAFEDGKIVGGGDWFDLTGFVQESTKPAMTE